MLGDRRRHLRWRVLVLRSRIGLPGAGSPWLLSVAPLGPVTRSDCTPLPPDGPGAEAPGYLPSPLSGRAQHQPRRVGLNSLARSGHPPGWHWLCQCRADRRRQSQARPEIAKCHSVSGMSIVRRRHPRWRVLVLRRFFAPVGAMVNSQGLSAPGPLGQDAQPHNPCWPQRGYRQRPGAFSPRETDEKAQRQNWRVGLVSGTRAALDTYSRLPSQGGKPR